MLGGFYNIFEAWLLSSLPLPSASKQGGQLVNEFFICSEDITSSPGYLKGWRIFKMTAVIPGPKILSRTRVQAAVKNRKGSGYVDCQQVRSIDGNLFFSKLKLLILRRWWQLWMKATGIKQRYLMNLFFVVFCLFVLRPKSMSKLIHNPFKLTCKLLIRTIRLHTYVQMNNWVPVFMF